MSSPVLMLTELFTSFSLLFWSLMIVVAAAIVGLGSLSTPVETVVFVDLVDVVNSRREVVGEVYLVGLVDVVVGNDAEVVSSGTPS